ncbi:helix-turn-helix transcriptional regulator [Bradyrhizobium sp. Ai1a-2]|uniref:helix-turn-helix domain-containing protein n=1 Tax=Bradyrhizobium sp. Ai1a-2 TaxID=196490 RepID=UPI0009FF1A16|nr:helix-turn-helix transcriptional regulator [Bradyrhizobium sp. Ai1a-2]
MKARTIVAWNVRRIRVKRGISQEKLAYEAGIDRSHMGSVERQSENPTIDLLGRIAEALGVHLSELFLRPPKGARRPKTLPKGRKPGRRSRGKGVLRD